MSEGPTSSRGHSGAVLQNMSSSGGPIQPGRSSPGRSGLTGGASQLEGHVLACLPPLRGLAAAIPVDPAGPDRYRGGAKPWKSYAPQVGGVADG